MANLFEGLEQLSPEELEAFLQAVVEGGSIEPKAAMLAHQLKQAEEMRGTPMPKGIMVRDQYINASPLAFADQALQRIQGGQGEQQALAGQQALIGQSGAANDTYLRSMLNMLRRKPQAGAAEVPVAPTEM